MLWLPEEVVQFRFERIWSIFELYIFSYQPITKWLIFIHYCWLNLQIMCSEHVWRSCTIHLLIFSDCQRDLQFSPRVICQLHCCIILYFRLAAVAFRAFIIVPVEVCSSFCSLVHCVRNKLQEPSWCFSHVSVRHWSRSSSKSIKASFKAVFQFYWIYLPLLHCVPEADPARTHKAPFQMPYRICEVDDLTEKNCLVR